METAKKTQLSTSIPSQTVEQITWLKRQTGMTKTTIITIAIRNLFNAEQRKLEAAK